MPPVCLKHLVETHDICLRLNWRANLVIITKNRAIADRASRTVGWTVTYGTNCLIQA